MALTLTNSHQVHQLQIANLDAVTQGNRDKAIKDLNNLKSNPVATLDDAPAKNILDVLAEEQKSTGNASLDELVQNYNKEGASDVEKQQAVIGLKRFLNDTENRKENVGSVLGFLNAEPTTQAPAAPPAPALAPTTAPTTTAPAVVVPSGGTATPPIAAPLTGPTVAKDPAKKANGQPLTVSDLNSAPEVTKTADEKTVKQLGDDLFIQSHEKAAIRVAKDGTITSLLADEKGTFFPSEEQESTGKIKKGEIVDIALTSEVVTVGADGETENHQLPTRILRLENPDGKEVRYGVFEFKDNRYQLVDKQHSSQKPSTSIDANQLLKYLHADGNVYEPAGSKKYLGPKASTVGADGGPNGVTPNYTSLALAIDGLNQIEKMKAVRKAGQTQKERQQEEALQAAMAMMSGQGGNVGLGNGVGLGFGADSAGNFNVGVGVQGTNFGFGMQFGSGSNDGFGGPGGFGFPGGGNGVYNLEEMLTVVFAILEQQERRRIVGYLKDMYAKSSRMGAITGDQMKDRPGILNQMNIESSISQAFLQNSMGKRQNMLETLYGIIKNTHDSKRRSINNIA